MYSVVKAKINGDLDYISEEGFVLGKKDAVFEVNNTTVKNIEVCDRKLANPVVYVKVHTMYKKLLNLLAELLTDDDDSGDSYREALNQIERFRMIIKNKYRDFLLRQDLEKMSKKLVILQKEANNKLLEIHNYRINELKEETNKRSR